MQSDIHDNLYGSLSPPRVVVFPIVCEAVSINFGRQLLEAKARPCRPL